MAPSIGWIEENNVSAVFFLENKKFILKLSTSLDKLIGVFRCVVLLRYINLLSSRQCYCNGLPLYFGSTSVFSF